MLAPSNLGLRPENGQQPGTWQAPRVLMEAGLRDALEAHEVLCLPRPLYEIEAQPRTRIRNGRTIRAFSFALAEKVQGILEAGRFPVVIGGDCSVLLGSLYGARLAGARGLVHVDGHSDFTQEKSYATPQTLGAAAGMDLALASGRGEPLLTEWPDLEGPLARGRRHRPDRRARRPRGVVPGVLRRHRRDRDHPPQRAGRARRTASRRGAERAIARLEARGLDRAWLHVDLDVLDEKVMPAVDSPGQPRLRLRAARRSRRPPRRERAHRRRRLRHLRPRARSRTTRHARDLVACIAAGIGRRSALREHA